MRWHSHGVLLNGYSGKCINGLSDSRRFLHMIWRLRRNSMNEDYFSDVSVFLSIDFVM